MKRQVVAILVGLTIYGAVGIPLWELSRGATQWWWALLWPGCFALGYCAGTTVKAKWRT